MQLITENRAQALCLHCEKPFNTLNQELFCCLGCKTVYHFLKKALDQKSFEEFYFLKFRSQKNALPVELSTQSYLYLDTADFEKNYVQLQSQAQTKTLRFYLEGVHCAACLWLIEKLPSFLPQVVHSQLNFGQAVATITIQQNGLFSTVAAMLDQLGYRPHALCENEAVRELKLKENRRFLLRVGIAGAATGNIMLMTVPLYFGLEAGGYYNLFRYVAALFYSVSLFYCAQPFFTSAAASLKTKTLSIDVPIVLAIILGSVVSFANLLLGSSHLYFDSLSALIFLLLASRFVLSQIQQKAFQSSHFFQLIAPHKATLVNGSQKQEISAEFIKTGDLLEVGYDETVATDGVLKSQKALFNQALLTGESNPVERCADEPVLAGSVNIGQPILMAATAAFDQSQLAKLFYQIEQGLTQKAKIVTAMDRLAKWFLLGVIALAGACFLLPIDFSTALNRALALLIVTCPCALALATPLTFSLSLKKAAREGIFFKTSESLEKASQIQNVVFDKTGTLTLGRFSVHSYTQQPSAPTQLDLIIYALEKRSKHAVAKAIVDFLLTKNPLLNKTDLLLTDYQETAGIGVSATIQGQNYQIKKLTGASLNNQVGVFANQTLIAQFDLSDQLRTEAKNEIAQLTKLNITSHLLTGDKAAIAAAVASELNINPKHCRADVLPTAKADYVKKLARPLMVGDGANDAAALACSFLSVAVQGCLEMSLRAADIYLTKPGVASIHRLIKLAKNTMLLVKINFVFSVCYNLVGATLALTGHITPFAASLLMPLSALTVYLSSHLGARKL